MAITLMVAGLSSFLVCVLLGVGFLGVLSLSAAYRRACPVSRAASV